MLSEPAHSTAALEHILRHHSGADGWITLSRKDGDKYIQRHYRVDELEDALPEWMGSDTYFSQNTFYRPQRRVENVRQLRALYVDLDSYLLNLVPEWVIGAVEPQFGVDLPEPNLIISSGRGLVFVWWIDPVPSQALPLWQAVQNYLIKQLQSAGSDARVSDAARILRMAGSTNSKSGQAVTVQYRHDYRYTLRDIEREYLPELRPRKNPNDIPLERPKLHQKMYRVYSLHYVRLKDLVRLCELRQWDMKGYRETTLFLYRYWSCCFLADPEEALKNTLEVNEQFTMPLSENEVIRATRSAEKAWRAKSNKEANELAKQRGFPGAGYNLSNKKIISWFDINEQEQQKLESIISREVKYQRNNLRRQKARRKAGMVSRDEYLDAAYERRQEAIRLREQGLTQKQIAEQLGVTRQAVSAMISPKKNQQKYGSLY